MPGRLHRIFDRSDLSASGSLVMRPCGQLCGGLTGAAPWFQPLSKEWGHGWEPQSVEVYAAALHGGHKKSESVGSEYKK